MKFSIILATLNRSKEIRACLLSFSSQEYRDFEIIIIDQSDDELTHNVIEDFKDLSIQYYHVNFKGLSKARNYGLKCAKGIYCCLADDDAVYTSQYLAVANSLISEHVDAVLSGVILSSADHVTPFIKYKGNYQHCVDINEIVNSCPSAALIFPTKAFFSCGGFDEKLGVGNQYASGEETDFLLRLYDEGYSIIFSNQLILYHPIKEETSLESTYRHYLGKGALFKIDFCYRKKLRLIGLLLKNTVGMLVKAYIIDKNNKMVYLNRKRGFVDGVITFSI